jgi:hypothetical protein
MSVPGTLTGLRSVFNAFHRFNPREARAVLESTVQVWQPIGIFEIPERSLVMMIPFLFTPLYIAIATPFIRPFHWNRLLWTYLIPLIPLTCWWDGLVSQWRAYTVEELLELTQDGGPRAYQRPGPPRNVSQRHPAGLGRLESQLYQPFFQERGPPLRESQPRIDGFREDCRLSFPDRDLAYGPAVVKLCLSKI